MSPSVRKKPARTSRKTATTRAAKRCGSDTSNTAPGLSDIFSSQLLTNGFTSTHVYDYAGTVTEKSTASTGPISPSGCAKNISNAARIGLGRRPRNLWPRSERFVEYGLHNDMLYLMHGERTKVLHEKVALPFVIVDSRMLEDDTYKGVSL